MIILFTGHVLEESGIQSFGKHYPTYHRGVSTGVRLGSLDTYAMERIVYF